MNVTQMLAGYQVPSSLLHGPVVDKPKAVRIPKKTPKHSKGITRLHKDMQAIMQAKTNKVFASCDVGIGLNVDSATACRMCSVMVRVGLAKKVGTAKRKMTTATLYEWENYNGD